MLIQKRISEQYQHIIDIAKPGLAAIFISARCKSKAQLNLQNDEDLRVEIDGMQFREIPPKDNTQLFNIPPAFNGSQLKGLKKTVIFFAILDAGKHTVGLIPQNTAFIEEVEVRELSSAQDLEVKVENRAEDGDRRPWVTFVLIDLPLKYLVANVTAKWRFRDSDDVKLIIDGKIQKNKFSVFRRNWLWSGSIFKKLFQKETQTQTIESNLPRGVHYIEFWADRMPVLHNLQFNFGLVFPKRYMHNRFNGKENYNRFDEMIVLGVDEWNKKFSKQDFPPPILLDPNLVKAMIYVESRMGYENGGYPDIMQVGDVNDPALHTLNNDGWVSPRTGKVAREYEWQDGEIKVLDYKGEANSEISSESIRWGVRWLYHKAQKVENGKRIWLDWKEAVKKYGPGSEEYSNDVWRIYKKGLSKWGIKLWSFFLIPFLVSVVAFGSWMYFNQDRAFVVFENIKTSDDYNVAAKIVNGLWFKKVMLANALDWNFLVLDRDRYIYTQYFDIDNNGQNEIIITGSTASSQIKYILKKKGATFERIFNRGEFGDLNEAFSSHYIYFDDINNDGVLEVIKEFKMFYDNAPYQMWRSYYILSEDDIYEFFKKEEIIIY